MVNAMIILAKLDLNLLIIVTAHVHIVFRLTVAYCGLLWLTVAYCGSNSLLVFSQSTL